MMKRFGGLGTKGKRPGRLGALAGMRGSAMPDLSELGDLGDLARRPPGSAEALARPTDTISFALPAAILAWFV